MTVNLFPRPAKDQSGTTLVEVLITVVLVSIGLLGLAGLQFTTVQNTNSASERFEATIRAQDILERMRANRTRALAGAYNIGVGDVAVGGDVPGDDLAEWQDSLAALPSGAGSVDVNGATGMVTIMVQWIDASDDNPDDVREADIFLRTGL